MNQDVKALLESPAFRRWRMSNQRSPYWPGGEQLRDCRSAHSARASAA